MMSNQESKKHSGYFAKRMALWNKVLQNRDDDLKNSKNPLKDYLGMGTELRVDPREALTKMIGGITEEIKIYNRELREAELNKPEIIYESPFVTSKDKNKRNKHRYINDVNGSLFIYDWNVITYDTYNTYDQDPRTYDYNFDLNNYLTLRAIIVDPEDMLRTGNVPPEKCDLVTTRFYPLPYRYYNGYYYTEDEGNLLASYRMIVKCKSLGGARNIENVMSRIEDQDEGFYFVNEQIRRYWEYKEFCKEHGIEEEWRDVHRHYGVWFSEPIITYDVWEDCMYTEPDFAEVRIQSALSGDYFIMMKREIDDARASIRPEDEIKMAYDLHNTIYPKEVYHTRYFEDTQESEIVYGYDLAEKVVINNDIFFENLITVDEPQHEDPVAYEDEELKEENYSGDYHSPWSLNDGMDGDQDNDADYYDYGLEYNGSMKGRANTTASRYDNDDDQEYRDEDCDDSEYCESMNWRANTTEDRFYTEYRTGEEILDNLCEVVEDNSYDPIAEKAAEVDNEIIMNMVEDKTEEKLDIYKKRELKREIKARKIDQIKNPMLRAIKISEARLDVEEGVERELRPIIERICKMNYEPPEDISTSLGWNTKYIDPNGAQTFGDLLKWRNSKYDSRASDILKGVVDELADNFNTFMLTGEFGDESKNRDTQINSDDMCKTDFDELLNLDVNLMPSEMNIDISPVLEESYREDYEKYKAERAAERAARKAARKNTQYTPEEMDSLGFSLGPDEDTDQKMDLYEPARYDNENGRIVKGELINEDPWDLR